jgi:hypothetical protein
MRCADLLHDALDKEIEDLQFSVEDFDELLIRLNPHHKLWEHVMPADNVDPAALGDVQLTLQLRPEALAQMNILFLFVYLVSYLSISFWG